MQRRDPMSEWCVKRLAGLTRWTSTRPVAEDGASSQTIHNVVRRIGRKGVVLARRDGRSDDAPTTSCGKR